MEEKIKMMEKGSRETRCLIEGHPCLVAFVYESDNKCCKPKIGGEILVTTKLSSESNKDQIQYMTMCERSIV